MSQLTAQPDLPSVSWTEDQVIVFPAGLPGFQDSRRFIILSLPQHHPFHWMECVENRALRFPIINPMTLRSDYNPKIGREALQSLNIRAPEELCMYCIVTLHKPLSDSTANMMGPLFINIRERVGKQIIIENDDYSPRERIVP